jgi:hypothetical protein
MRADLSSAPHGMASWSDVAGCRHPYQRHVGAEALPPGPIPLSGADAEGPAAHPPRQGRAGKGRGGFDGGLEGAEGVRAES